MRTYRKAWRTKDFKTILTEIPPGTDLSNLDLVALVLDYRVGPERPPAAPGSIPTPHSNLWFAQLYNRIAACDQWVGYDANSTPIDGDSGITLANKLFDVRDYASKPDN
jgi:hypothetical protein